MVVWELFKMGVGRYWGWAESNPEIAIAGSLITGAVWIVWMKISNRP